MQLKPVIEPSDPAPTIGAVVTTRMQQLRSATRSAHDRIELALPVLDPSLSRARYLRVLEAFFGFYKPLEPRCERAAGVHGVAIDLAMRAKVPLLVADLAALGRTPADLRALPRCCELPAVTTVSQTLGVLYVVEGATLGGQIIQRHLRQTLDLDASNGAAFFVGYGVRTRERWIQFASCVERAVGLDLDGAIAAAIETFETLECWLSASLAST
jgi:heme oxygenase